jgi:hypothetical protein
MEQRTYTKGIATIVLAALGCGAGILCLAAATTLGLAGEAAYVLASMVAGGAIGVAMRKPQA